MLAVVLWVNYDVNQFLSDTGAIICTAAYILLALAAYKKGVSCGNGNTTHFAKKKFQPSGTTHLRLTRTMKLGHFDNESQKLALNNTAQFKPRRCDIYIAAGLVLFMHVHCFHRVNWTRWPQRKTSSKISSNNMGQTSWECTIELRLRISDIRTLAAKII